MQNQQSLPSTSAKGTTLKKQANFMGLLFAGVGGMIGSGWLFGPLETATQAGPLSVCAWLIGGVVVMLIALVFAELATLFPLSGALVHMSDVSHGPLVGFVWGWILILAYIAIAPIEAMAIVSYASAYIPDLTHATTGVLTVKGFAVAALILALMVALNFMVIKTVLAVNSWITVWKIFVPIATAIVLISYSWHPENFFTAPPTTGTEGWAGLHFKGIAGPLAALAAAVGAAWWATILYADAIVSPGACGFVYTTTTSRIVMASAENRVLSKFFARLNANGVPWAALILTYFVGLVLFLPFPSWQKMVGYISSITVLSYGIGPILLICLRQSMPDAPRPFKLAAANWLAPLAFVFANWVMLWAGLATLQFIFGIVAVIVAVHLLHQLLVLKLSWADFKGQSQLGHAW